MGESIAAMRFDSSGHFIDYGLGTFDNVRTKNIDVSGNMLIGDHSGGYIWNIQAKQGHDLSGNLYASGSSFINMHTGYLNFGQSSQGQIVSKSLWVTDALNVNLAFIIDSSGNIRSNNVNCNNIQSKNIDASGCQLNVNTIVAENGHIYFGDSYENEWETSRTATGIFGSSPDNGINSGNLVISADTIKFCKHYYDNATPGPMLNAFAKVECGDFQANPVYDSSGGFQIGSYQLDNGASTIKGFMTIPTDMRFNIPTGEAVSSSALTNITNTNWSTDTAVNILNNFFTGDSYGTNPPPSGTMWIDTHTMTELGNPILYFYIKDPNDTKSGWYGLQLNQIKSIS